MKNPGFQRALLFLLVHYPQLWRLRRIEQIYPINDNAYQSRVSVQFQIPTELFSRAEGQPKGGPVKTLVDYLLRRTDPDNVEVLLPIATLPKKTLVAFSVRNMEDKPLMLPLREDACKYTLWLIEDYLASIADQSAREKATRILNRASGLAKSVLGSASREASWQLETDQEGFSWPYEFEEREVREIKSISRTLRGEITKVLGPQQKWFDELLNPFIWWTDFELLVTKEEGGLAGSKSKLEARQAFILEVKGFLQELLGLMNSADNSSLIAVTFVLSMLSQYARHYLLFTELAVTPEKQFMIKYEQIIPLQTASSFFGRTFRPETKQQYWVSLQDYRSNHIQIIKPPERELWIDPAALRIYTEDGKTPLALDRVFPFNRQQTSEMLVLYTTFDQVKGISRDEKDKRPIDTVYLEVTFRFERILFWTYFSAALGMVILSVLFIYAIAPDAPFDTRAIALIVSLFAFLYGVRTQEPIILDRLRVWKWLIFMSASIYALYFTGSYLFTGPLCALRSSLADHIWLLKGLARCCLSSISG